MGLLANPPIVIASLLIKYYIPYLHIHEKNYKTEWQNQILAAIVELLSCIELFANLWDMSANISCCIMLFGVVVIKLGSAVFEETVKESLSSKFLAICDCCHWLIRLVEQCNLV